MTDCKRLRGSKSRWMLSWAIMVQWYNGSKSIKIQPIDCNVYDVCLQIKMAMESDESLLPKETIVKCVDEALNTSCPVEKVSSYKLTTLNAYHNNFNVCWWSINLNTLLAADRSSRTLIDSKVAPISSNGKQRLYRPSENKPIGIKENCSTFVKGKLKWQLVGVDEKSTCAVLYYKSKERQDAPPLLPSGRKPEGSIIYACYLYYGRGGSHSNPVEWTTCLQ